jgi:hypothetical protein
MECTLSIFTRLARARRVCVRAGVKTPRWWCVRRGERQADEAVAWVRVE